MRLIDADALMIEFMDKDLDQTQGNDGLELCQIIDEQPTVCDIDAIRAEIEQICTEEREVDFSWSAGLRYSLQIIQKHMKGGKE